MVKVKPHAILVPYPAEAHLNTMLKVAKLIHQEGYYITFVVNEYVSRQCIKARGPNALAGLPEFKFAVVPDGLDGLPNQVTRTEQLMKDVPYASFRKFVDDLRSSTNVPPISFVVRDANMQFAGKVASEIGVPCGMLWAQSACAFLCCNNFWSLVDKGILPLKDESCLTNGYLDTVVDIPGLEGIRLRDLPSFVRTTNPDDVMFNFYMKMPYDEDVMILNSFDQLEYNALHALYQMFIPKLNAVGPLLLLEEKQIPENSELQTLTLTLWAEDLDCLNWLDKKEPNSVLYINFGSHCKPQELLELGWGLANSKQYFLWAIGPDFELGEYSAFPAELKAEFKERGLFVGWAPQEKVLKHPSIGGLLTQGYWNSVLGSVVRGVPMLCWPAYGEQYTNCWSVCNHWGIGMEITEVKRDVLEGLVRELMVGEKGKKMKAKALEWKKAAEDAASKSRFNRVVYLDLLFLSPNYKQEEEEEQEQETS